MTPSSRIRAAAGLTVAALLAACTQPPASTSPAQVTAPQPQPTPDTVMSDTGNLQEVVEVPPEPPRKQPLSPETRAMYAATEDNGLQVPAIEDKYLSEDKKRQLVDYYAPFEPGTIIVDPGAKRLYHLQGDDTAMRYTVAVGAAGREFSGEARIPYQRDWPTGTPTQSMIEREPDVYTQFEDGMEGGLDNPLGARALYLHQGGEDTLYRIHGTRSPWSIGKAVSSGCIRLFNQDVIHLADQVSSGTRVIVLSAAETGKYTRPPSDIADGGQSPAASPASGTPDIAGMAEQTLDALPPEPG